MGWHVVIISFENSVDPDQLALSEASWSGSTMFFIHMDLFHINDEIAPLNNWLGKIWLDGP